MDVNDARRARGHAGLDKLVVLAGLVGIQRGTELIVHQPLPGYREAEDVEVVTGDEVVHLASSTRGS